ncbi:HNH endonuclease, partial [Salmonella enterica subsp. enterica serovar Kentucky]|uniref:HNH endonuclease n=1 Tax=Salmonella enterica TaxID=28901 RepID=UPI003F4C828C
GQWTEARFNSFIKSALRGATRKWAPIQEALKDARVERGYYKCNACKAKIPATIKEGRKRTKNAIVDHIEPIIDPTVGFTTWDECIERMFCEKQNLQVLCKKCHDVKCAEERALEKARRAKEKANESK